MHNLEQPLPSYLIGITKENHKNLVFLTHAFSKLRNFGTSANRTRGREEIERTQVVRKYFDLSPPFSLIFKVAWEVSP